jgi:RND family efflux transporter MFP subunit
MIRLLDVLILITSDADNNETLLNQPLSSYSAGLLNDRAVLNATLSSIQNSRSGLTAAREAITRAALGATNSQVSVANAQVKIALGSLRSAQANYEKTLIRTPISGVVNALYVKTGEYVTPGFPAAIIANNDGLEITTAISQEDREGLEIGDAVTLDNEATGVIGAIAGAVDPTTGKVALKIGVDKTGTLKNGSTVSVFFSKETSEEISEVKVPLSAIKMTGAGPVVFSVSEAKTLTSIPVTLGAITGDTVVVTQGVSLDSVIVVDARGLKEGQAIALKTE